MGEVLCSCVYAAYINSLNVKIIREAIQSELIKQSNLAILLPSRGNLLITSFVKGELYGIDLSIACKNIILISCQTLSVQGIFFRRSKLFVVRCLVSPSNRQTRPTSLSRSLSLFLSFFSFLLSLCLQQQRETCFHPRGITDYPTTFPPSRSLFKHPHPTPLDSLQQIPHTFTHSTNIMKAWKGVVSFFIISYCVSYLSADNWTSCATFLYLTHIILNPVCLS